MTIMRLESKLNLVEFFFETLNRRSFLGAMMLKKPQVGQYLSKHRARGEHPGDSRPSTVAPSFLVLRQWRKEI